jgi:hypothetical protein
MSEPGAGGLKGSLAFMAEIFMNQDDSNLDPPLRLINPAALPFWRHGFTIPASYSLQKTFNINMVQIWTMTSDPNVRGRLSEPKPAICRFNFSSCIAGRSLTSANGGWRRR